MGGVVFFLMLSSCNSHNNFHFIKLQLLYALGVSEISLVDNIISKYFASFIHQAVDKSKYVTGEQSPNPPITSTSHTQSLACPEKKHKHHLTWIKKNYFLKNCFLPFFLHGLKKHFQVVLKIYKRGQLKGFSP